MQFTKQHPVFFAKEKINQLCQPLFRHTPFTMFTYVRFYYNGYSTIATQMPEFNYQLYADGYLPSLEELHAVHPSCLYLSCMVPIPDALQTNKFKNHIEMAKNFDLHHQFVLSKKTTQYREIFVFGLDKLKLNVIDISINHLRILQKFSIYFCEVGRKIIDEMDKAKILFEKVAHPKVFEDISFCDNHEYKRFIANLKLKKYPMRGKQGNCFLSQREFECLLWVYKNRSMKQIGRILSLSPKTVECHIASLRKKLGCCSMLELSDIYSNNPIIDVFSDH